MRNKNSIICIFIFLFCSGLFSSALAQDSPEFSFAVMGCMHLGVCDQRDFESAVKKMKECGPDFAVFTGGMIDSGGEEPVESLWRQFDDATDKLGAPVYDVASNCRLSYLSVPPDRTRLMERNFLKRYGRFYYSFAHKNNLFICLDSVNKTGLYHGKQLNFLKNIIAGASGYDNVFIFINEPVWLEAGSEWLKIIHPLIRDKVRFVFASHNHYLNAQELDGVTYVITGCPPCYLRVHPPKSSFFSFLIIEVLKDSVSVEIVPIDSIPIGNLGTLPAQEAESAASLHPVVKPYFLTSRERELFLEPQRVVRALGIKPGMDILDIGCGTGLFTFRFAEALKGTGTVFATDIDPDMIEYIKKKTQGSRWKNVFPVTVKPHAVDPFYKEHSFDLIFMSEAYQYLWQPEDYFRGLRPSLKKGGRIYIIHAKNAYDFSEVEIMDFRKLVNIFISKEEGRVVLRKLDRDVQRFVNDWQGEEVPPGIRAKIIDGFNRTLTDRRLFYDLMENFMDKGVVAEEGEWSAPLKLIVPLRDLKSAKLLFVHLDAEGIFDGDKDVLTDENEEQLRMFNKMLLCDMFGINRLRELQAEWAPIIYVKKESIISALEKAGYRFIREFDFLPYHYFLEFKKDD